MNSDELLIVGRDKNIENIQSNLNNRSDNADLINMENTKSNPELTPKQRPDAEKTLNTPLDLPTQSRIMGDVSLTPTYRSFTPQASNPHNTMVAITPIASGSSQAKNSIKLQ